MAQRSRSEQRRWIARDAILPIVLSMLTSFGVTTFSLRHNDNSLRREAARAALSTVYLPLARAAANVVSCVPMHYCSDAQLYAANRALNRASVLASVRGSEAVAETNDALDNSLGRVVRLRLAGKRPSDAAVKRTSRDFVALQGAIEDELSR